MIRVVKNSQAPKSLTTTHSYDREDVKRQLIADQSRKCYLCERTLVTDFEIEHLDSNADRQEWSNLFLACRYCNGKKQNNYDDILNPATNNIEALIRQEIVGNKATFTSLGCANSTVNLLNSIHNGISRVRNIKEEQFFEYVKGQVNSFSALVLKYCLDKTVHNRTAVAEELEKTKEFLGFKYWIICSNSELEAEFATEIVWNKQ